MPSRIRARLRQLRRAQPLTAAQPRGNIDENREYWNTYAHHWTDEFRGFEVAGADDRPARYEYLGDEWGHPEHVTSILDEFVFPNLGPDVVAVEVGSGGGRIAARVAPRVKHLVCVDLSTEMLEHLRTVLADRDNVSYVHAEDVVLPPAVGAAAPDFIYAFDVFVHLDLHTMWKYVDQAAALLRPGGRLFLHTANLVTEEGWRRFAAQQTYSVEGHYFITPDVLKTLAARAGLRVVHEGAEDPSNFYKARDYLVLFEK